MAEFTHASPCMPIMPMLSGCDAGKPPIPSSVCDTGMMRLLGELAHFVHRARQMMPCPARISGPLGRLDQLERALNSSGRALSGDVRHLRAAASQSNSHDDCCASFVMSMSTGPGRPDAARWNASLNAGAMSSTRVTR